MWCKRDGPVLAVKNTHKVRNTGCGCASLVFPFAFLLGKHEGYYCPKCGALVQSAPPAPPSEQPDEPGPSSLPDDSGVADALLRLSELHRRGELTDDEFRAAKGKLLSD
jgi:Short C-terminal domain